MSEIILDLFCGLGGWSKGFAAEGFKPVGVDIINVGYPYKFIQKDIKYLDTNQFKGIKYIIGSPPCRDFSRMSRVWKTRKWKNPPDPQKGLLLVGAFCRIVEELQPKYWLMENVSQLEKYIGPVKMTVKLTATMRRSFWGVFPDFLVPMVKQDKILMDIAGPLRAWKRAEIPLPAARAAARAFKL